MKLFVKSWKVGLEVAKGNQMTKVKKNNNEKRK
jgi:hypothetical protein